MGNTYPVPYFNQLLANLCTMVSYANIAYMLIGPTVLNKVGWTEPSILTNLREQKLLVIGIHFLLNMVSSNLVSSGAFEIIYNNQLIHSKIQTGTVPTSEEIIYKLRQLVGRIESGNTLPVSTVTHVPITTQHIPGSEEFTFDNMM